MKYSLFYSATLLGALWLQVIQNHFLGGSLFSVQLLVIAAIYTGLEHGALAGCIIGFFWGLLSDAASLGLLGERAILFTSVGFLAGHFRRQLDDTKPWTQCIFTLLLSYGVILGEFFIEHVFAGNQRPVSLAVWLQPVWNAIAAPFLFFAFRAWDMMWSDARRAF